MDRLGERRPTETGDLGTGRVLLTGASGYLGGYLAAALERRGHDVVALLRADSPDRERKVARLEGLGIEVIEGDLLEHGDLGRACRGVDAVVHAAAVRGGWSRRHTLQFHVNVDGTAALMRAAFSAKVERVVHVSSSAAVGATRDPRPLTEDEPWSFNATPNLHYMRTKREAEERVLHALRNGLPAVVVNPTSLVGRPPDGSDHRRLVKGAIEGRPHRLPEGGSSFAHVEDVADSVVAALQRGVVGERYLLGGVNLSWSGFHEAVARHLGREQTHPTWPAGLGPLLAGGALVLDGLRLSRPAWAPERFRAWGWYTFADSSKAHEALGHPLPPIEELLERVLGPARGPGQDSASRL